MELTYEQKQEIFRNGFVKVPGVVPQVMVDAALRSINNSVGEGMNVDEMTTFRSRSYCPELQGDPSITDLLNRTPRVGISGISNRGRTNYSPKRRTNRAPISEHTGSAAKTGRPSRWNALTT